MVRVVAHSLGGATLEFIGLDPYTPAPDLKHLVAKRIGLAPRCLQLVADAVELDDEAWLADVCPKNGDDVFLTVVCSLDGLRNDLEHGTRPAKLNALTCLANLQTQSGEWSVCQDERLLDSVTACLASFDSGLRKAAVCALGSMVRLGEEGVAVAAASTFLDHNHAGVRGTALEVLGLLAKGTCARERMVNEGVVDRVSRMLDDPSGSVREAAISALEALVGKTGPCFKLAVTQRLDSRSCEVRLTALIGLLSISEIIQGDTQVVRRVIDSLNHSSWEIRHAAITCLKCISTPGDAQVTVALRARLEDQDVDVSTAARSVLEHLQK